MTVRRTSFLCASAHLLIEVCSSEALGHAVLESLHCQLLKVHPGTHVIADAILQDVTHRQHLQVSPHVISIELPQRHCLYN